jgi:hypothetical protein
MSKAIWPNVILTGSIICDVPTDLLELRANRVEEMPLTLLRASMKLVFVWMLGGLVSRQIYDAFSIPPMAQPLSDEDAQFRSWSYAVCHSLEGLTPTQALSGLFIGGVTTLMQQLQQRQENKQ